MKTFGKLVSDGFYLQSRALHALIKSIGDTWSNYLMAMFEIEYLEDRRKVER